MDQPDRVRPPEPGRVVLAVGAAATFATAFLLQFVATEFPNDHFVHLSRARQILLGELPVRDFFDPGMLLQYYVSAGALALSGHNLFGEIILTSFFIAVGAALVWVLATRLSGSVLIGLAATILVIVMAPRPYGYPKAFLYVLAIAGGWRYVSRPTLGWLTTLSGITAIAFLFRHDHGVYIAGFAGALIVLRAWPDRRRSVTAALRYAGLTALLLLPFWIFIQTTVGLPAYARGVGGPVGGLTRLHINLLPFTMDPTLPLIQAIEQDPEAAAPTTGWERVKRWIPLLRVRVLPGVLSREDALAWLYYVYFAIPIAGLWTWIRASRAGRLPTAEFALVGASLLLALVGMQTLVRGSPDSRIVDVSGMVMVVAAWMVGRWLRDVERPSRAARAATIGVATLWCTTLGAAALHADLRHTVSVSGVLRGPAGIVARLRDTTREFRRRPIETWNHDPGLGAITRYALACTTPADRLFVTWFAPHVFFYAERAFGGGQVYLHPGWHAREADQRLTVDRLRRQRVPIVIGDADLEDQFARRFPHVYDYVTERYQRAARSSFGGRHTYTVWVDPDITPMDTYQPLGLPCFAPSPPR